MASICKSIHCIFGTIHDHPFFVLKVNPNNLAPLASDDLRESLSDMIFSEIYTNWFLSGYRNDPFQKRWNSSIDFNRNYRQH